MNTVTLSTKCQLVIPREVRDRLALEPGAKLTVIEKGGILYLVPEKPVAEMRGVARGAKRKGLRDRGFNALAIEFVSPSLSRGLLGASGIPTSSR